MTMIKTVAGATTALVMSGAIAQAGGFERGGHSLSALFEAGRYAEFSLGYLSPEVSAEAAPTGDIMPDGFSMGFAYKADLNDTTSVALIVDQPWQANVQYPIAFGSSFASLRSTSVSVLGRYKINEGFSVHGGLRYVVVDARVNVLTSGVAARSFEKDGDLGYVIGAAYERPDIALRVALTYFSGTDHSLLSTLGNIGTINPPQSVNLDFQTGIAANTLLFGQVRWADWTDTQVNVPPAVAPASLISYTNDVVTYTLGVGRKFSDTWSGAVSFGYEKAEGGNASLLAPTDGYKSIQVGATYTMDNMKISGGVRYVDLGNANTAALGPFANSDAVGLGLKVGYSF